MKDKALLVAQSRNVRSRKLTQFILVSVSALVVVVGVGVFSQISQNRIDLVGSSIPAKALTDFGVRDANNERTTQRAPQEAAKLEAPDFNDELAEIFKAHPLFSTDILLIEGNIAEFKDLKQSNMQAYEILKEQIDDLFLKIQDYVSQTLIRLDAAISAGDKTDFENTLSGTSQYIERVETTKYNGYVNLSRSTYFSDFGSMIKARAAQDLRAELDASLKIRPVIELDGLDERIGLLRDMVLKIETDQLETSINMSVSSKNFSDALSTLSQLKIKDISNVNIENYESIINEGMKLQRVQYLVEKSKQSVREEKFDLALQDYQAILAIDPLYEIALEGIKKYERLLQVSADLDILIATPARLADLTVAAYADTVLEAAKEFKDEQLIALKVTDLQIQLATYQKPIDVVFISDNKARIEIRGVGYIEPTKSKIVSLRPGKYLVNAVCAGYKNNLMEVVIMQTPNPIEVTCGAKL